MAGEKKTDVYAKKIHELKKSKVITSLLGIVLGVVLIVWPNQTLELLCRIVGVGMIAGGVVAIVMFFVEKEQIYLSYASLVFGVIIAVIGLWLFLQPAFLVNLIPTILGLLVIVSGIVNISEAVTIRREHGTGVTVSIVLAAITLALGLLIFFHPSAFNAFIYRLIGIILVYDGVSNLYIISKITGVVREIKQEAEAIDVSAQVVDADENATTNQN